MGESGTTTTDLDDLEWIYAIPSLRGHSQMLHIDYEGDPYASYESIPPFPDHFIFIPLGVHSLHPMVRTKPSHPKRQLAPKPLEHLTPVDKEN